MRTRRDKEMAVTMMTCLVLSVCLIWEDTVSTAASDLKQYLLAVCGDKDTKKKLKSMMEEKASGVGLLVCRRFVNFPYELVPKMYDPLFDEFSWATEDEPTQELRDSFRFKQYLLVVRIFERKTPAKHKAKNSKDEDEPVTYPKLEDDIFRELSLWSFTFPIHAEQSAQQEVKAEIYCCPHSVRTHIFLAISFPVSVTGGL